MKRIQVDPGDVVDAASPRGRRGGDLLRPRRLRRLRPVGGRGHVGVRGRPRRLHRPSPAGERPHAPRGRRRPRRARVRPAHARSGGDLVPAHGRGVARRDVDRVGDEDDHPWKREAAEGPAEIGAIAERPANIVNVDDVEVLERDGATVGRRIRDLGEQPAPGARASATRTCCRGSSTRRPTATRPRRRSSSSSTATAPSCSGRRRPSPRSGR